MEIQEEKKDDDGVEDKISFRKKKKETLKDSLIENVLLLPANSTAFYLRKKISE